MYSWCWLLSINFTLVQTICKLAACLLCILIAWVFELGIQGNMFEAKRRAEWLNHLSNDLQSVVLICSSSHTRKKLDSGLMSGTISLKVNFELGLEVCQNVSAIIIESTCWTFPLFPWKMCSSYRNCSWYTMEGRII